MALNGATLQQQLTVHNTGAEPKQVVNPVQAYCTFCSAFITSCNYTCQSGSLHYFT